MVKHEAYDHLFLEKCFWIISGAVSFVIYIGVHEGDFFVIYIDVHQ